MYKTSRILKLALLASLVAAMALMISCTREIEVPGETIIVEKEVVKTVEVPGQTVTKEVVKTVEVPGQTVIKEVVKTVEVPGQTVIKEVVKTVEVPGQTVIKEVVKEVEVEKIVVMAAAKPVGYMMTAPERVSNRGGTLKTAFGVTMGHFDAHQGTGTHVLGHAYDGLLVKNIADGLRTFAPLLATDWAISGDGKSYSFTIRDGVKFHDGTPMTVDDVVYSFNRMALPQDGFVAPQRSFYDIVTSVKQVGDDKVEFTLSEPRTWLLEVMSGTSHVVYSRAQIEANDNNLKSVEIPTGTGPFTFVDHLPAEKWVFDANMDYWNPEVPYIDRLELLHVAAWTDRGTAVLTGQADFSWNVSMETHEEGLKRSDIGTRKIPGFGAYNVNFNNKKAPFDDKRVRKAIFLAVSKQALQAAFGRNEPMKLTGWMSYAAEGASSIEQLGTTPGYREDKTEDLITAKALMAEAGYADGFGPIDLVVSSVAPHSEILAPVFQDELKTKLGITSKIRVIERSQLGQNALAGEYDIQVTTAFSSPTQDPSPMWMQRLTCEGSQNQVHYCNPEFDTIVSTLNVTSDPGKRAALFAEAKAFLDEENPLYVIGFTNHLPMWRDYVKGMAMEQRSHTHWGELTTVWLDR